MCSILIRFRFYFYRHHLLLITPFSCQIPRCGVTNQTFSNDSSLRHLRIRGSEGPVWCRDFRIRMFFTIFCICYSLPGYGLVWIWQRPKPKRISIHPVQVVQISELTKGLRSCPRTDPAGQLTGLLFINWGMWLSNTIDLYTQHSSG